MNCKLNLSMVVLHVLEGVYHRHPLSRSHSTTEFMLTCALPMTRDNVRPGLGVPMNKSDWTSFLNMQLTIGAANLDTAAANISSQLPLPPGQGLRPAVVLSV